MSRGTTRRSRLGAAPGRSRTARIGDEDEAVGAAAEAGVQAPADEGHCPQQQGAQGHRDAGGDPGLAEQLGQAGGLVRGEDDPRDRIGGAPALDGPGQAGAPSRRQHRLAPAGGVIEGRRAVDPRPRAGPPGQLQGPGAEQAGLPGPWLDVCGRPRPGELARGHEVAAPLRRLLQRNSAAAATSPGSSTTRSVPGPRWSRPLAGQTTVDQTSAASPMSRARHRGARRRATRRGPSGPRPRRRPRAGRDRRSAAPAAGRPASRGAPGSPRSRRRGRGTRWPAGAPPPQPGAPSVGPWDRRA